MSPSTDQLIERLVSSAEPVRRLRPPMLRACLWLLGVAAAMAIVIPVFANFALFDHKMQNPAFVFELIGTLLTGITAVIAAFHLSLPDRSRAWALLPLPFLILWLASSGYNCYSDWIEFGTKGWRLGESASCFGTIVGFSVPLGASLLVLLLRAKPISPGPVAALGGLGIAGIAAFLLDFNHPVDASFLDLAWHAVAVGFVILATSTAAKLPRAFRPSARRRAQREHK